MEGNSNALPFPFVVDVRNIAEAHIQAAVSPKAKGQRFLVSNADTVPNSVVIAVLKERFPGLKFKDAEQEDRKPVLDNSKVNAAKMIARADIKHLVSMWCVSELCVNVY